jgi:hypothetical protein
MARRRCGRCHRGAGGDRRQPARVTLVWCDALVLRHTGTPAALGLVRVPVGEFVRVTIGATIVMTLLFGVAEMTTHPYRDLLDLVRGESTPDSTFAWVIDHGRGWGLVGFAVYGALVTIFAEEVVFRGALLTWLRRRGPWAAVAVGLVGGLAAYRTRSIHPALIAITVANVVVLAAVA